MFLTYLTEFQDVWKWFCKLGYTLRDTAATLPFGFIEGAVIVVHGTAACEGVGDDTHFEMMSNQSEQRGTRKKNENRLV